MGCARGSQGHNKNGDFVSLPGLPLTGGLINRETGVNWRKIKAEYIAGGVSQRELAEKYDVPVGTLEKQARKGQWTKARKRAEEKAAEKVTEKTAEAVADNAVLLERAKTALLLRAVRMAENYPGGNAQEVKKVTKHGVSTYRFKDIAAVLSVLEEKQQKGQATDIEDLAPLAELLNNE